MLQQPDYNGYEQQHDADIRQWFAALGPPPTGQVSPHLHAKVLAQIEQRRAGRGLGGWLPPLWSPTWTVVCVAGLVLSLTLNVWWAVDRFTANVPDPDHEERPVSASRFLSGLQHPQALRSVVSARAAFGEQVIGLGFAPHDARLTFFRMGTLYADALAALHSEALEVAAQRVDVLVTTVERMQALRALADYLREMQTLLQSRRYAGKELATFLALFEPLFEDVYVPTNVANAATLFQVGAWMENMALAATTGDKAALRQEPAMRYLQRVLTQLDAPREVLDALIRLRQLVADPEITDTAIRTIQTLVTQMQYTLGGIHD
jgi:hypothetical protein